MDSLASRSAMTVPLLISAPISVGTTRISTQTNSPNFKPSFLRTSSNPPSPGTLIQGPLMTPDQATNPRFGFDEALSNMLSNSTYSQDYLFYVHVIGQCKVIFDTTLQAPAGVNFMHDHYNLYINPFDIDLKQDDGSYPQDDKGNEIKSIPGFNSLPLEQRMGVLKHECLHIINSHITRKEERDHQGFNIAADCAINQLIERSHLPDKCIFPDQFPSHDGRPVPEDLIAEQYYELLKTDENNNKNGGSGSAQGLVDDHSKWEEFQGDADLADDISKSMLEKAVAQTQKSKGSVPSQLAEWLSNLTKNREVDWRQVFKRLTGNKKSNTRKTLMRRDRRLPDFNWIKGKTKNRIGVPVIIGDESGSVSDSELTAAIAECLHICKTLSTDLWYVPVDYHAHDPHIITSSQRSFKRSACGGTELAPALAKIHEKKIPYNALVIITDNHIDESDIDAFLSTGKPVIWLITSHGTVLHPKQTQGRSRAFKLKPRD